MKNQVVRSVSSIIFYVVIYLLIQTVVTLSIVFAAPLLRGEGMDRALEAIRSGGMSLDGQLLGVAYVLSSLLTIGIFVKSHWAPVSRAYLAARPWATLCWVGLFTLGTILPSEWIVERINVSMPEHMEQFFEQIMGSPAGYLAIGILAPLAEEIVFRGAILRTLLKLFDCRLHWVPIILSAFIFGGMHLNLAQFVHAFAIGMVLGWMYYRTDSIVPGVVLHWVNNTVAYVMFNLMPQMADGKLIDLFHGSDRLMVGGLFFSLCILLPSLYQLTFRLSK